MTKEDLLLQMSECGLGLKRNTLSCVLVKKEWVDLSKKFAVFFSSLTEQSVQSIGSSCVFGLLSKPILDFLLLFPQEKAGADDFIAKLKDFGFTHKGDMVAKIHNRKEDPTRHFFALYDEKKQIDFIHIHALAQNSQASFEKIAFRNTLLKSYKNIRAYNAFKLSCLEKKISREDYRLSKEKIIADILTSTL